VTAETLLNKMSIGDEDDGSVLEEKHLDRLLSITRPPSLELPRTP